MKKKGGERKRETNEYKWHKLEIAKRERYMYIYR